MSKYYTIARIFITLLLLCSSLYALEPSLLKMQPPYLVTSNTTNGHVQPFSGYTTGALRSMYTLDPWWYNGRNFKDRTQVYERFLLEGGRCVHMPQPNHAPLRGWYFDRGSDHVIVLSFFNAEAHAPYVESFKNVDILIFEYQPHTSIQAQILNPYQTSLFNHAQDTQAAVTWLRAKKHYAQVIGLGVCRSSFIYAYAQAQSQNTLFDKLVLDSPFYSIENFLEIIASDPLVTCYGRNQRHVFPGRIRAVLSSIGLGRITRWLAKKLWDRTDEINILTYIKDISVPVLIVHGTHDVLLSMEQVGNIWNHLGSTQKALLVTSNPHSRNHCREDKELYAHVVDAFLFNTAIRCSLTELQNCETFF